MGLYGSSMMEKFLLPGRRWAASAGRKRNAGANLKIRIALQTSTRGGHRTLQQVFRFPVIQRCRPHSSSVTSRFRRADWRQLLPGRSDFALRAGPEVSVYSLSGYQNRPLAETNGRLSISLLAQKRFLRMRHPARSWHRRPSGSRRCWHRQPGCRACRPGRRHRQRRRRCSS